MHARTEEHTGRSVQLAHHNALGTVDNKSAFGSHVGNGAQIDIRYNSIEILMIRVLATEAEFGFQRNSIGQAALDTLLNGVAGMIDLIVKKSQCETIARIVDREVLIENLEKPLVTTLFRRGVHLYEVLERLQLNVQKVRIRHMLLHTREVDSLRLI